MKQMKDECVLNFALNQSLSVFFVNFLESVIISKLKLHFSGEKRVKSGDSTSLVRATGHVQIPKQRVDASFVST